MSKIKAWIHDSEGREIPVFIHLEHGSITLSFKNARTGQLAGEIVAFYEDGDVKVSIADENNVSRDTDPMTYIVVQSAAVRLVKLDAKT